MLGLQPEEGLEGSHWGAAPVESEGVLVEVDLEMPAGGAAVGSL